MKFHTCATLSATLCILYMVGSLADVSPQKHRSDEAVTWKRRRDTTGFNIEDRVEELTKSVKNIEYNYNSTVQQYTDGIRHLEQIQDKATNALIKHGELRKEITENFQKKLKEAVAGLRKELDDLKRDVVENTNTVYQKCVIPLETLNQTVQQHRDKVYEDLYQQVAELRKEQKQLAAAAFENFALSNKMEEALEDISQLKNDYISKVAELRKEQERQAAAATETFEISNKVKEALQELRENHSSKAELRDKRAITNKCSLNVHHKTEGGGIDMLMVMDPPDIEPALCN